MWFHLFTWYTYLHGTVGQCQPLSVYHHLFKLWEVGGGRKSPGRKQLGAVTFCPWPQTKSASSTPPPSPSPPPPSPSSVISSTFPYHHLVKLCEVGRGRNVQAERGLGYRATFCFWLSIKPAFPHPATPLCPICPLPHLPPPVPLPTNIFISLKEGACFQTWIVNK